MCAIHGLSWPSRENIKKMISLSKHRGPDSNCYKLIDEITLGHNLLSIMDSPANSVQPLSHENMCLVYNGEIYNYNDLKTKYNLLCTSNTDTEVLIKGIKKNGLDFLNKVDGMFALGLYDNDAKTITLARDVNGAKPLYYSFINNQLLFSSEIKSLLSLGLERKVDNLGFKLFFKQGYIPGPRTIYKNIFKLTPGEIKIYDIRKKKFTYSSNLNNSEPCPSNIWNKNDDINENIYKRLELSVAQTSMGIRKQSILLSGGIDSAAIFHHIRNKNTKAYSTRFKMYGFDDYSRVNEDSNLASKICQVLKMRHANTVITPFRYVDNFDAAIYALESPIQSKSLPAYYCTFKRLHNDNNTVVFSGDGGDEIFAGYKHHLHHNWETKLKALCVNNKVFKNQDLNMSHQQQIDYLNSWLPCNRLDEMDNLSRFLYIERLNMLAEDFLIRSDKLGMAFSLESRFPMLNRIIKDYVDSIPMNMKLGNEAIYGMKPLLKNAYRSKIVPDEIFRRGKTGWRYPTDEMLIGIRKKPSSEYINPFRRLPYVKVKNVMREWVREQLNDPIMMDIFEYNYFDIDSKYICNYDWREKGDSVFPNIGIKSQKELFSILSFKSWYKQFDMSM